MTRFGIVAAIALACEAAPTPVAAPQRRDDLPPTVVAPPEIVEPPKVALPLPRPKPPDGLVDLQDHVADLRLSIGYATAANFTGAPLPGYERAGAWAHPDLAKALVAVDAELGASGLGLLVYDAYRPVRATKAMVEWTRVNDRGDLLEDGYISAKSQHNRGLAIDLTLVDRMTGTPLDMGGAWDTFDPSSAAFAAKGDALANRKKLRAAMTKHGFAPHDGEWWHFSYPHGSALPLDVPY